MIKPVAVVIDVGVKPCGGSLDEKRATTSWAT